MKSLRLHRVCRLHPVSASSVQDGERLIHVRRLGMGLAVCCALALVGVTLSAGAVPARAFRSNSGKGVTTGCRVATALHAPALDEPAQAAVHIYLYDANGNPVDVSATYIWHEPHVYDPDEALVGTTDAAGNIYDANLALIGYVTLSPSQPM